jgi:hypothetical protein
VSVRIPLVRGLLLIELIQLFLILLNLLLLQLLLLLGPVLLLLDVVLLLLEVLAKQVEGGGGLFLGPYLDARLTIRSQISWLC